MRQALLVAAIFEFLGAVLMVRLVSITVVTVTKLLQCVMSQASGIAAVPVARGLMLLLRR
jgi:phosphate/sulfate permease